MRTQRIALSLALSIGAALAQGPASAQEYRGTYEQQMACTPDVWRLCSDQIPDVGRIVTCLRQNTPQLSSGCRAVFETSAAAPPQQRAPNGRIVRGPPDAVPPPYVAQPEPQPGPYYEEDY